MFGKWLALGLAGGTSMSAAAAPVLEPDVPINPSGWHVVINMPQTRLFAYQDGVLRKSFPVAVGKMLTQTPLGSFSVTGIHRNPTWHVPKSIQEEMRLKGKPVETVVPPGPKNPLGKVFMRIGEPRLGLGMHGTNAPGSVPGFRSHGCVRLKNEDALELAGAIQVGASVSMVYQSVLLHQDSEGNLWLTAYRDQYKQKDAYLRALADALLTWQREHATAVHGKRVDSALKQRDGKPVCLTCAIGRVPPKLVDNSMVVRWVPTSVREATPAAAAVQPVNARSDSSGQEPASRSPVPARPLSDSMPVSLNPS